MTDKIYYRLLPITQTDYDEWGDESTAYAKKIQSLAEFDELVTLYLKELNAAKQADKSAPAT